MKRHSLVLSIGLALFLAPAILAQPEPLTVDVDCDAGDDLAQALREIEALVLRAASADDEGSDEDNDVPAEWPLPVVVNISGTCVANVVLTLHEMTLRGVGDEPAVIQGSSSPSGNSSPYGIPVLDARNIQNLHLENLTVSGGWFGLRLVQSLAVIDDCVFSENGTGLQSENSISIVNRSRFERNRTGIFTFGGDHLLLQYSVVAENEQEGVNAYGSNVSIYAGEILDNRFGLYLGGGARGLLGLDLRVDSLVSVIDGSHLSIYGPATIAGDGEIFVGNTALFEAYEAGIQVDVLLARWGRAYFTNTPIEGDVVLYDFSEVRLVGTVSDLVYCDATSDAVCEIGSVGAVMGCEHCDGPAPTGATPDASFTPPGGAAARGRLDEWLLPVQGRVGAAGPEEKAGTPSIPRRSLGR